MFDQILGLPAHPLIIHFAVVLTPLLVAVDVAYALLRRWRSFLAWAVVALSVAAPGAVFAAKESGERLRATRFGSPDATLAAKLNTHQGFATPLLWTVIGLAVAGLALVYVSRQARGVETDRYGRGVTVVLSAVTVVLAGVVGYYCFRAGDSGARAVWGV